MPYRLVPLGGGKYRVENAVTGKVHAKRTTKRKAEQQIRLMRSIDQGKR